jgi:hypothetical protein
MLSEMNIRIPIKGTEDTMEYDWTAERHQTWKQYKYDFYELYQV